MNSGALVVAAEMVVAVETVAPLLGLLVAFCLSAATVGFVASVSFVLFAAKYVPTGMGL